MVKLCMVVLQFVLRPPFILSVWKSTTSAIAEKGLERQMEVEGDSGRSRQNKKKLVEGAILYIFSHKDGLIKTVSIPGQ